eukprot:TRINITY_DN6580_c0_g1_i4.p1 TRINITY_DN6580_c0_g1~~TRINITY_DN6580_c0_g1_i4.p1  ORF type:complete len:199 (+),score=48.85 TRINITY_DN6580_c0_g1_i4:36-599(+)
MAHPNPDGHTPFCANCNKMIILCSCEGIPHGEGIVLARRAAPLSVAEKTTNFKKWVDAMTANIPGFDGVGFARDFSDIPGRVNTKQATLRTMMEEYMSNENQMSQLARITGTPKHNVKAACMEAVSKLEDLELADMSPIEATLINNMYQSSDPVKYPLGDQNLKRIYDIVAAAMDLNAMLPKFRGNN